MAVRPNGMEDTPQYRVNIDQHKASALGVSLDDINTTLSTAWQEVTSMILWTEAGLKKSMS